MPSMQSILTALPREALRTLLHAFDVSAQDARKTDSMVRALGRGLPKDRARWLGKLPVATLKAVVADTAAPLVGSGKAALVAALCGDNDKAGKGRAAASTAKSSGSSARPAAKRASATPAASKSAAKNTASAKSAAGKPGPAKSVAGQPAVGKAKTEVAPATKPAGGKAKATAAPATQPADKAKTAAASPSAEKAPPADAGEDAAGPDAAAPAAPRHMLSWSEAVALATKRGQSAATMIGQPASFDSARKACACPGCAASLEVQDCHIHSCDHSFVAQAGRKICAECMFERNNMSVDAFHERLREDWLCPHCQAEVPRP